MKTRRANRRRLNVERLQKYIVLNNLKMSISKKHIFLTSFIIVLCFILFYFVYPKYIQKIEMDKHIHHAQNSSKLIINLARYAIENNNFTAFYKNSLPLFSSANMSYLVIFDGKERNLFQLNNKLISKSLIILI